ncbi:MAG: L,D-transpeptidase [Lachnospiraceae bacterium]|nr:L,D-transpeptidase [Lachnospiraceae bacterium]
MKKYVKISVLIILTVTILLGLVYLGLAVYYKNGFSYGTYINGIYCTGKSVEETQEELNNSFSYEGLTIHSQKKTLFLKAEEIEYSFDFREPLIQYRSRQNPYLWIENLWQDHTALNLNPKGSFNAESADNWILKNFSPNVEKQEVLIKLTGNGYELRNNKQGIPVIEKIEETIKQALEKGQSEIWLDESICFQDIPYTENEKKLMSLYEHIGEFQQKEIVYSFGSESVTLSPKNLADVLQKEETSGLPYFDENGLLAVSEENIQQLLKDIMNPYHTYRNHHFLTHDGQEVYINTGNYGNEINFKTEAKWLYGFLNSEEKEAKRKPEYKKEALFQEKNDIGDTYIEVDMTNQKLYYIKDGELLLESEVVTGNTGKNRATPQMVCYVYGKQRKRTLKGPGYEAFVNYWMPVNGGIGIHDASWRSEFGGNIYQTNGSHGCINMPIENMETLYRETKIGTPVVLYYLDESES